MLMRLVVRMLVKMELRMVVRKVKDDEEKGGDDHGMK